MLTELRISHFATIESIAVEFGPGLNILTGDEGTAKSIIVDALSAVLSAPPGAAATHPRGANATVEARFALDRAGPVARWLREQGLSDRECVVRREMSAQGRSQVWINGRPETDEVARGLGDLLVEVTGPHEGQGVLRPSEQLDLLDAFGGPAVQAMRDGIAERVRTWTALRDEQRALIEAERDRLRQIETLTQQIREIDAAGPQPDEERALMTRRVRLVNAERLAAAAQAACNALSEPEGRAVLDQLARARAALRDAATLDPFLGQAAERVGALETGLAGVARELARYVTAIEARPGELAAIEARLELFRSLRKYGDTVDAILAFRSEAAATLARLQASGARGGEITSALDTLEGDLADRCERLTTLRREAAARLEADVERQLGPVEMGRLRLTVAFARDPDTEGLPLGGQRVAAGPTGVDRVEFLVASRGPAEGPQPLERIASGGELSRMMLAILHVVAQARMVPVLVCDDIDAGVTSRTARALGQLLEAAARTRQVLCFARLPQIACLADRHVGIVKETAGGRPRVQVHLLEPKERVEEIARMLSGRMPMSMAREYAVELLGRARRRAGAGTAPKEGSGGRP